MTVVAASAAAAAARAGGAAAGLAAVVVAGVVARAVVVAGAVVVVLVVGAVLELDPARGKRAVGRLRRMDLDGAADLRGSQDLRRGADADDLAGDRPRRVADGLDDPDEFDSAPALAPGCTSGGRPQVTMVPKRDGGDDAAAGRMAGEKRRLSCFIHERGNRAARRGAVRARASTVVLAHGAGAPMDSPFMNRVSAGLASRGIRVARFEFAYMARRRTEGRRGAPDREPALRARWKEVDRGARRRPARRDRRQVDGRPDREHGRGRGGGARARVLRLSVPPSGRAGAPAHGAPGGPAHAGALSAGDARSPSARARTSPATRSRAAIRIAWLEGGDHSFKPPARSGRTEAQNVEEAIAAAAAFVAGL